MFLARQFSWYLVALATVVVRGSVRQGAARKEQQLATGAADNTTIAAWASFSTSDVQLVAKNHQNATVSFFIRGEVTECVNITFTYDPEEPNIQPLEGIPVCPHQVPDGGDAAGPRRERLQTDMGKDDFQNSPSTTASPQLSGPLQMYFLGGTRLQKEGASAQHLPPLGGTRLQKEGASAQHPPPLVVNVTLDFISCSVGKTILGVEADSPTVDVTDAFVRVSVIHDPALEVASDVLGWTYSIVWDISFLPQIFLNWKRKSVEGFSLDNVALNNLAYFFYMLFNVAFYAIPFIKGQFQERYPRAVNHVRPNDVFFASYAFVATLLQAVQCCIYKRGPGQTVSKLCRVLVATFVMVVMVACLLVGLDIIWWLDVFYLMSYLKLIITPMKYTPQVYINYKRKSTVGFSVLGVTMDFTGSVLSLGQMFLLSANSDDWASIFTNFAKFGLGLVGIFFDIVYMAQHYHYSLRYKLCKREVI